MHAAGGVHWTGGKLQDGLLVAARHRQFLPARNLRPFLSWACVRYGLGLLSMMPAGSRTARTLRATAHQIFAARMLTRHAGGGRVRDTAAAVLKDGWSRSCAMILRSGYGSRRSANGIVAVVGRTQQRGVLRGFALATATEAGPYWPRRRGVDTRRLVCSANDRSPAAQSLAKQ
jgi:hypothetical protein